MGTSAVFFSYIGFDAISTTAEECKDPQRDLPKAMFNSLIICTVIYVLVALVLTGMTSYKNLNVGDPLAYVFSIMNSKYANYIAGVISISAVIATASVETIGPTGVEMEALTAASLAVLTLYDMLKPHCEPHELVIRDCRLQEKKGGKSHYRRTLRKPASAAVIVLSDTVYAGRKPDTAGKTVADMLEEAGFSDIQYQILPDDAEMLRAKVLELTQHYACVVTVGGTGISRRDITVDTLQPLLERELPGLMEAARAFGQQRTPYAALSRGVAGYIGKSLLLTLPGSRAGARESLIAILPALVHIFDVFHDVPHAGGYQ